MTTVEPACRDDVATTLQQFGLIGQDALNRLRSGPDSPAAPALAALVEAGHLTRFQAQAVQRGLAAHLVIGDYVLLELVGAGTMGTVYKARSRADGVLYAVKLVPRRSVINLKVLAEKVEALKRVRHPRVSAMVQVGTHNEWVYAVYPFLESGEKLDAVIRRVGRLAPRQAAQVAQQVASGLRAYHRLGLFHGLLKPNDVVIGKDRRVRVLDFGVGFLLACERGKALLSTTTNAKAMTRGLDCASPESIMDPLARTPAGDQYSLGCILYFCLTGRFPFPDENPVKKMLGHQFEQPEPVRRRSPQVPERLEALVDRLLAKKPADRYPDIGAVVEELQELTADAPAPPPVLPVAPLAPAAPSAKLEEPDETEEEAAPPTARRRPMWMILAAGASAGTLAGLITWWARGG